MILTLDDELAQLVTDLKWADWTTSYTLALVIDADGEVCSACVLTEEEDVDLFSRLEGIRADYWSIGELYMDLLCSVAYGFPMTRPTGSHRYVLALLEAIRRHESGADA